MSRRRELDQHRRQLAEIAEIMRSMKNLAYMETRKLTRLLDAQALALAVIEAAAADFLAYHPELAQTAEPACRVLLLIGSERGFCGDFNEELLRTAERELKAGVHVIAVGSRLTTRLERADAVTPLQGPGVAEEIAAVLKSLTGAIDRLQAQCGSIGLSVCHHRNGAPAPDRKALLPPFAAGPARSGSGHPPVLNLPPRVFFAELVEHYLLAVLHEIFYTSMMSENQRRIQHLEGAVRRLDEKGAEYARRSRILRQEEITEEIEVILLSAEEGVAGPAGYP